MADLINSLLDIARIEATVDMTPEATDLDTQIGDVAGNLLKGVRDNHTDQAVALPDTLPPVGAHQTRLVQVMTNLQHNGVKHTPEGGGIKV